ncbi:hypothetical protein HDV06_006814 [Boothiomyces sp. JEL0866]|nr:hypothetical protein HDV06_006814 [Boothiomyces sp. JEL0866]
MRHRIIKRAQDTPSNAPASPPKATQAPSPPPAQTQQPAPPPQSQPTSANTSNGSSSGSNPPVNPQPANPAVTQANGNSSPNLTQAPTNTNAANANSNTSPTGVAVNGVNPAGSTNVVDGNTVTQTNAPTSGNSTQNNAINFASGGFIAVYVIAAMVAFGCFLYIILNAGKRKPNNEAFRDLHAMDSNDKFEPQASRSPINAYSAVPKLEDIPVFTEEVASHTQSLDSGPTARIDHSPDESLYLSTNAPGWSGKRPGVEPVRAQSQRFNRPQYMSPVRSQSYGPVKDQDRQQYISPSRSQSYGAGNDQDVWGYPTSHNEQHYSYPSTYTAEEYEQYGSPMYSNQPYHQVYSHNNNYDDNAIWEGQPSYRPY